MNGDEKQIRQMTGLLLDNAMKYAEREIKLSLRQKGKKAELILWNTAEDLPAGNHDELFERFYRPDSSRNSKTGGSGIGLSIVKSIVEAHHGKISAVSKDGKSVEFKAVLPL
ncbi:MAG: ATP-binding protein [Lachnospiraceae bacterium]|nr:ATP-binding protein [Lachnospiraceae bacterium]